MAAIFRAKGRPPGWPCRCSSAGGDQVDEVAPTGPGRPPQLAARFWPGPLTIVVPARPRSGRMLGGDGATVGRPPAPTHPLVPTLCRRAGPLAVTSANRHGEPPSTTAGAVRGRLRREPDVALVARRGNLRRRALDGGRLHRSPPRLLPACDRVELDRASLR